MDGSLIVLLHAHLPYVRHPEYEYCIEENWFFEAVRETYIPLLALLERMANDGISPQLTFSLSPTLTEMLNDDLLRKRFVRSMDNLIALSEAEAHRTGASSLGPTAMLYAARFKEIRRLYLDRYNRDLVAAFRRLQDEGHIEIVATAATHAFLPAYEAYPQSIKNQIALGITSYIRNFKRAPSGFWLPECGYFSGLDYFLKDAGIRYFFMEMHGIVLGKPRPAYSIFKPVTSPAGLNVFGRDFQSARQVWSAAEGYPGDPYCRDFYRDIGFDLPGKYIDRFMHTGSLRTFTGMKYYRVTGATDAKLPYDRAAAMRRTLLQAADFIKSRESQVRRLCDCGFSPVIFAAFDAELFGHWWFEGIEWLDSMLRNLFESRIVRLTTPGAYVAAHGAAAVRSAAPGSHTVLHPSSWGTGGYGATWVGRQNHYLYRHLHKIAERSALLTSLRKSPLIKRRIINQAAREMFLAQSSDWPFLIEKDRAAAYAEKRVRTHIENFNLLFSMAEKPAAALKESDREKLHELEDRNSLFAWLDYPFTSDRSTS